MSTAPSGRTSLATRATLRALAGTALAVLALKQMFTDWGWVFDAWLAMAVTVLPAAYLRRRSGPAAWQLLPGLALTVLLLTVRFLPQHAVLGLLPGRGSWPDVSHLATLLHDSVVNEAAPLHTTAAIRFFLAGGLALLAALVDLLAVRFRLPGVAGVGFLLLFVISGAVARHPVEWFLAAVVAAGFLLVLSANSDAEVAAWGGRNNAAAAPGTLRLSDSGRRIGVIAVLVALIVSAVFPIPSGNVIANSLHHGSGTGGSGGVVLDPLATLRGQLTRSTPQDLFTVAISGATGGEPFYLRENTLDTYTGQAWVPGIQDPGDAVTAGTTFASDPPMVLSSTSRSTFRADITIQQQRGAPPVFSFPTAITGLGTNARWSPKLEELGGVDVTGGDRYSESVSQVEPTQQQLEGTTAVTQSAYLQKPDVPEQVTSLVTGLTQGITDPYDRARAISNYFTDPSNGFTYSLSTKTGESGNDLLDFLTKKAGFCQQYAAAMAVMLRLAGIPSRVVVGYTHAAPDATGHFQVTTDDAHAWVEAYFDQIGWIPFDPTPLGSGTAADAARSVGLPWAPRPNDTEANVSAPVTSAGSVVAPPKPDNGETSSASAGAAGATGGGRSLTAPRITGAAILLVLLLGLIPAVIRSARRRRRFTRGRAGDPAALWDELADTCVDLGLPWTSSRTARQVVQWLREYGLDRTTVTQLGRLVEAVELDRYGPSTPGLVEESNGVDLVGVLRRVRRDLLRTAGRGQRLVAALRPMSLVRGVSSRRSGGADGLPFARAGHRDGP